MENAYLVWFMPEKHEPYIVAVFSSFDRAKLYVTSKKKLILSDEEPDGLYDISICPFNPEPEKQPKYYLIQGTSIGDIEIGDIGFRTSDVPVEWNMQINYDKRRITYEGTLPAGEYDTVDSIIKKAYEKLNDMFSIGVLD